MKIFKVILATLLSLLLIVSPVVFLVSYALSLPPVYSETFYGALNEKYDRLVELEGEKIVVVGGSSVAFGLDSALLERYTGMPVVNFGLYADLGTKMMLDLSLAGISKGDVVVLAPELDAQTLSLYFNNDSALMALDDDFTMARHLTVDDLLSCVGGAWRFAETKRARLLDGNGVALDAVYRSEYFNEYGDFTLERGENVMKTYYDSNNRVLLDLDGYGKELDEFLDYVNDYVKKCERRGATVYFSFCPMNELGLSEGSDLVKRSEFQEYLAENLNCEIISDLDDYILEAGYFFDTNFHLNDAGVKVRTIRLAKDLRIAAGIMQGSLDEEPEAPALPFFDVNYDGEDDACALITSLPSFPTALTAFRDSPSLARLRQSLRSPSATTVERSLRCSKTPLTALPPSASLSPTTLISLLSTTALSSARLPLRTSRYTRRAQAILCLPQISRAFTPTLRCTYP